MQPASTMSELMVKIIYPASDAIFYITTREPKSEAEWVELQGKALAVAESANLLMMPGRARDQDRWMQDAQLMLDAGRAAFRAAKAKDVAALDALNDQLYTSCTSCHQHYRPNYGRRPAADRSDCSPPLHCRFLPLLPLLPLPPHQRSRPSRAAGSCARRKTCAPTARSRASLGRAPGRLDRRRARRLLRADHVERHTVVRAGCGAGHRADEGDAAQLVHRVLRTVHDQRRAKAA